MTEFEELNSKNYDFYSRSDRKKRQQFFIYFTFPSLTIMSQTNDKFKDFLTHAFKWNVQRITVEAKA